MAAMGERDSAIDGVVGGAGQAPPWTARLARLCKQLLIIVVVTGLLGEAFFRWGLSIPPLTNESIVWKRHQRWGWAHEPGAEGLFVKIGCRQPVKINSKGLRERETSYQRSGDRKRVLVIGDSFTVGFEVPRDKVYTRVLEDKLRAAGHNLEVINAGCRGYGTDQSLLFLMDEGIKYKPDLVLYAWVNNDPDDNRTIHRPHRKFGKAAFHVSDSGELQLKGAPVPEYRYAQHLVLNDQGEISELAVPLLARLKLMVRDTIVVHSSFATALVAIIAALPSGSSWLGRSGSLGVAAPSSNKESMTRRRTIALLRQLKAVSVGIGARFMVLNNNTDSFVAEADEAEVEVLGESKRFFELRGDRVMHIPHDPHYSVLGHEVYGQALYETLQGKGVIESL